MIDTTTVASLPPNTLGTNAFLFMAGAWTFVLTLMLWSFKKLMSTKADEPLPPPGSIP
ncbi:MAG TPA: hypothetical protein VFN90_01820 [Gemmatimonadales bacterium]|nr:hypothetical protein [Gemmatimonadales bacterium]